MIQIKSTVFAHLQRHPEMPLLWDLRDEVRSGHQVGAG